MAGIFKKLSEHDYQVTAFKAHKSWTFSGDRTGSGIFWLEAYDMGIETFAPNATSTTYVSSTTNDLVLEPTNSFTTEKQQYHYKRTVWNSIHQLYYKFANEPFKTSGPNRIKTFPYYGETLGEGGLRYNERFLGSSAVVISVPQETFGERIKPSSVRIMDNENDITLYDDGYGNLYDSVVPTGSAVSDTGLVGWWSFNESDTYSNNFLSSQVACNKVIDKSLSGNSSKVSGTPYFVSVNVSSSAGLKFGGDDKIEGTDSNFPYHPIDKRLNVRAVSFNFSGSNGGNMIQLSSTSSFEENNNHQWKIGLNNGKVTFDTVITSGSYSDKVYSSSLSTNNTSYDDGVHHCVCQIKDGFKEVYLDGSLVASESIVLTEIKKKKDANGTLLEFPQYIQPSINKLDNFRFGSGSDGGYTGYLDEVRIYNRTLGSDEITTLNTHPSGLNFIGNVFYGQGLITITNREHKYRNSFRTPASCSIRYKGDVTIYEHEITCPVNKGEFNQTLNRSARVNYDSNNENLIPELTGSEFKPYVTTVGLYDDEYNLIAVGKLSEPVSNDPKVELTFVVRFDA